jgi:hypothetical protein
MSPCWRRFWRRGNAGVGAVAETIEPSMNSISSALSPSVNAELEPDSEYDRLNGSTFTILGILSCLDFPEGDTVGLWAGLRGEAPPLTGELLPRAVCRVGVRGVGKELEDEVEDGGLGMAERQGVLGFEVWSSLFGGGVVAFRAGEDEMRADGMVGEEGERSVEGLVCSALWGSGLMGRAAFPCDAEFLGLSFSETPSTASLSSSELLTRLRVPRRGGEGGTVWDSTRADLGRYLGRAEVLLRGRGRSVDLLVGTAELTGVLPLAGTAIDAGDADSLWRAARLREVRVIVSLGEVSSWATGRSPMEPRRSMVLFVVADPAHILRRL